MNEVNILHLSDSYFGRELFSDINEDLIEKRKITYEEAMKIASEFNLEYIETSALTGKNIEESCGRKFGRYISISSCPRCFN